MNAIDRYGSYFRVSMKLQTILDTRQPCGRVLSDAGLVLKL